jgi:GTP-binding protein
MVIVVNKWDLISDREQSAKEWKETVGRRLAFAKNAPLVLASAKTGQRAGRFLSHADALYEAASHRVPTPELNRWLAEVSSKERASPAQGRSVNLLYATQTGVYPPTIVVFCNDPLRIHFSLRRFLDNTLRDRFPFGSVPIRLQFRGRKQI